jgi:hypothetical protein
VIVGVHAGHGGAIYGGAQPSPTGNDADSRPTIITSGGANTKGTAVEIFSSVPVDLGGLYVSCGKSDGTGFTLMDIMIGASLADVLVPDLPSVNSSSTMRLHGFGVYLPIYVPAGARLGARVACSTATRTIDTCVFGVPVMPRWMTPFKRATMYGTVSASSRGTILAMGSAIHTMPATFTQIVASTLNPINTGLIFVTRGGSSTGTVDSDGIHEIALGAGNGTKLLRFATWMETGAEFLRPNVIGPLPLGLPAAQRFCGGSNCLSIVAGVADIAVSILGFD